MKTLEALSIFCSITVVYTYHPFLQVFAHGNTRTLQSLLEPPTREVPEPGGPVTSHILDISLGQPASGVNISMYRMGMGPEHWVLLQTRYGCDDL